MGAFSLKKVGTGLANTGKGLLKGDLNQAGAGITDALKATPGGALASSLDKELKRPGVKADNREADARAGIESAKGEWQGLGLPDIQKVDLQGPQYVGDVSSAYGGITTDPRLQEAQNRSLSSLDEIIQGGGMNDTDRANIARDQAGAAQQDRGRREAILQNQQSRGMGGSGNSLLAQLQSSQAATDRNSQTGLDVAGMAQQRAMDAIRNSGEMAGSMRTQAFNEQATKAGGQDAISQFNATNKQGVNNATAQAANQGKIINQGIPQQNFNNQVIRTSGITNQGNILSAAQQQEADRIRKQQSDYLGAAVQGGAAAAKYMA